MNNANAKSGESSVRYAARTIRVVDNSAFQSYALHFLQRFNIYVGCADARRRNNRDRCASCCSAHPIYYYDITPESFAEKRRVFNDNLESLFSQSRELEVEMKKQLAGLVYE
jgi:hypothetical protein